MAQTVVFTDDITGDALPEGNPTTRITVTDERDNVSFEIDLSDTSFKALLSSLSKYRKAGRVVTPATSRTPATGNSEAKDARAWALAQPASAGLKVSEKGMVSRAVLDAYRAFLDAETEQGRGGPNDTRADTA